MVWRMPRHIDHVATISVSSVSERRPVELLQVVCVEKLTGDRGVEICLGGALALSHFHPASPLQDVQPCSLSYSSYFLSHHHI
jgi:hypothetical protein